MGDVREKLQPFKPAKLGGRLPKQIQRALPLYLAAIVLILFFSRSSFPSPSTYSVKSSSRAPLVTNFDFPRKIWQTWKVDSLNFAERDLTTARTWTSQNPSHRYEVLTDDNDIYYVEEHFGPRGFNRPDIVSTYRDLTAKIIKADILRYLVMYAEGGVYADIDVEAIKPVARFVPDRYRESELDMIVGVEIDEPGFKDHPILGPKSRSFCQWTFMARPRLPVMLHLVEGIMKWLNGVAERQGVGIGEVVLDFDEVISGTGPSAFTKAILDEISRKEGRKVTWDEFHQLAESKLVGGVLVLTVEAFAAGQGHSDSGNHNARTALVKHRYHASGWPSKHKRFSHPVYGEVERCNWEQECVKLWDANMAAFNTLSEEEKAKMVAIKEVGDAQMAAMEGAATAALGNGKI